MAIAMRYVLPLVLCQLVVTVVTGIRRLEKEDASVQGAMVNSPAWNSLFNKFHAKIFSAYIINADTIITKKKYSQSNMIILWINFYIVHIGEEEEEDKQLSVRSNQFFWGTVLMLF